MLELKNNDDEIGTRQLYLFALKSPLTRVKYVGRLEKFFDFMGLEGTTVEEKSRNIVLQAKKEGNHWVFHNVLRFIQFQLDRVRKKEITG